MKIDVALSTEWDNVETVRASLEDILTRNHLCALTSIGPEGAPHINTAYFAPLSSAELVFWTSPKSRHSQNLSANPAAAIAIYDSRQPWGSDLQGLQAHGSVRRATGITNIKAFGAYAARYAGLLKFAKAHDEADRIFESKFYVFHPDQITVLDESRLGKEKYVVVKL